MRPIKALFTILSIAKTSAALAPNGININAHSLPMEARPMLKYDLLLAGFIQHDKHFQGVFHSYMIRKHDIPRNISHPTFQASNM